MRAPKKEILHQNELQIPKEFLRFATPAGVAAYRAERMKCNTIAEIGCGIGAQTIAFASTCKKVIAIEIDGNMLNIAKESAKKLGINNIEFIDGDALFDGNIKKIKTHKPDIIFCDTQRKESGERSIDDLKPDIRKLIGEYGKISDKIAIEVPPYTNDLSRLEEDFEKEFISVDRKLNRLTLYFNKLKKCERSAVALPEKARIEDEKHMGKMRAAETASVFKYLYIIDPAVSMAELADRLGEDFKADIIEMGKKFYFVSNENIKSAFLEPYRIVSVTKPDAESILESLKKLKAGKVVLRYTIPPEDYWKERKMYESQLKGDEKYHLFKSDEEAILCESLSY